MNSITIDQLNYREAAVAVCLNCEHATLEYEKGKLSVECQIFGEVNFLGVCDAWQIPMAEDELL